MLELKVKKRTSLGRAAKALREAGTIPAELYGHGIQNIHVAVDNCDFEKIYKEAGENTVVNVVIDGDLRPVLIYDVMRNSVTDKILAIDFYQVKMDEKIETAIPLEFIGESPAVKSGCMLIKAMDEVEVRAFPQDLPEHIDVDLSTLIEIGNSLYIRDLPKGEKYEYTVDPDTVIVSVMGQVEEEVVAESLTPEDVVAETEEKKAERGTKASSVDKETEESTKNPATPIDEKKK